MATLEQRLAQQREQLGLPSEFTASIAQSEQRLWYEANRDALDPFFTSYEDWVVNAERVQENIGNPLVMRKQPNKSLAKDIVSQEAKMYAEITAKYGAFNPLTAALNANMQSKPKSLYDALSAASGG